MSVGSGVPYNAYTGNGLSTVFAYGFTLLAAADLVVTIDGVVTSAYTVSGIGVAAGGSITFSSAPASGTAVLLRRVIQLVRSTEYQSNGDLQAETVNDDFDRLWTAVQQVNGDSVRALRAPELAGIDDIPAAATRANRLLAFDATGAPEESPFTTTQVASAIAAAYTGMGTADAAAFIAAGTGAVTRTVQSKLRDYVSVKDFGATGDGTTDDTAAIQAAIDSFSGGLGTVYLPKGVYLVTSTLSIILDRMNIVGDGQWVTQIKFAPTATDICMFFGKGGEGATDAGIISRCTLRGLSFTSANTTNKKTAIELKDVSFFQCDDVAIGSTTQWIGGGSIGVRVRGREGSSFSNMIVQTNRPFVFAVNTSYPTICLDHFNFHNIFTACRGHFETVPVYTESHFFFEPGANFSNLSFSGFQSWVRGQYGLYYDNSVTPASAASYALNVENVRWEGAFGDNDTGYCFYLVHGAVSALQTVMLRNVYAGEIGQGYYFRDCQAITLANCVWSGASRKALDITGSSGDEFLQIINCFWQTGCTASIGSEFVAISGLFADNTAPIYKSVIYAAAQGSGRRDLVVGVPITQGLIAVAAADPTVVTLPLDATATVIGMVTDSRGKFAIVGFNVVGKTATLIYNDGTFSVAQGTAAKLNVYWDGVSAWKLENKTGVSRDLYFQSVGSNQ